MIQIQVMKSIDHNFLSLRDMLIFTDSEELFVASRLQSNLNNGDYSVLNNLLIPSKTNIGTAQIDHVVVSVYGIFCIETKSHKGLICESEQGCKFTQYLSRNKYPMIPNPLNQNEYHIKALTNLLGHDLKEPIISLVVFPSADKIITPDCNNVGSMPYVIDQIKQHDKRVYRYAEAKKIIEKISNANLTNETFHIQHVNRIKKTFSLM